MRLKTPRLSWRRLLPVEGLDHPVASMVGLKLVRAMGIQLASPAGAPSDEAPRTKESRGRKFLKFAAKVAVLTVVLMILLGIAAEVFLPPESIEPTSEPGAPAARSGSFLLLVFGLLLLQTISLAYPVTRSRWGGWLLSATVFILYFGTVTFMMQMEALIYMREKVPTGTLSGTILMGFISALLFAPIVVWVMGKGRTPKTPPQTSRLSMSRAAWTWKLLASAGAYFTLYHAFGYFLAWKVTDLREFYGGTDPGTFSALMVSLVQTTPWILPFQFFRGLLWVAIALPLIRMMKGAWWETGVALSLLFTMPAMYLLMPNALMPEEVRMAHLVETASSQFLFAWFVAWLFASPSRHDQSVESPASEITGV